MWPWRRENFARSSRIQRVRPGSRPARTMPRASSSLQLADIEEAGDLVFGPRHELASPRVVAREHVLDATQDLRSIRELLLVDLFEVFLAFFRLAGGQVGVAQEKPVAGGAQAVQAFAVGIGALEQGDGRRSAFFQESDLQEPVHGVIVAREKVQRLLQVALRSRRSGRGRFRSRLSGSRAPSAGRGSARAGPAARAISSSAFSGLRLHCLSAGSTR